MREVKQSLTHVQDFAVILEKSEAEYWTCESFCDDKRFFKVPVPDLDLEDCRLCGGFNIAVRELEFEGVLPIS